MSAALGRPGFSSGPRKLKIVLWPRSAQSLRAGMMCRKAGWYFGAKKKAKPCSRRDRAASSGPRSNASPSASITSALPVGEVLARLPCLATRTPAAAAMIATVVEMLKVLRRSPHHVQDFGGAQVGIQRRLDRPRA